MGVYIKPCRGCPARQGCDLRDEFRRRVSGLGLRSASFRCARLSSVVRLGRRILVSTMRLKNYSNYEPDYRLERVAVPATIVGYHDAKFSCVVDKGSIYGDVDEDVPVKDIWRFRKKKPVSQIIKFLDEPDREICTNGRVLIGPRNCDRPEGEPCYCLSQLLPEHER